jgi:hypothetical protein
MPECYSRYEYVLHLPQKAGGGERVIFEAILCGCLVITNDNACHKSWSEQWDWQNRDVLEFQLRKAPFEFWKQIEQVIK